ncbi:MAG: sensor histidine kinase, partial [Phaeodactylibacter sp.]|nr:sensor histidine kinase [Phaeodactylibacter sp.]
MLKNPTPQEIAVFVSLYITAAALTAWLVLEGVQLRMELPWVVELFVMGAGLFTAAYFTTIYYLRKYIYRKIKLIYKTIHKHKVSSQEKSKSIDVRANIIDEVEKQVAEWAEQQKEEIDKYKAWA